jgi:hypothetical protein
MISKSDMDGEVTALGGKLSKGAAGQAGDDVRVVDPAKRSGAGGEGEAGVMSLRGLRRDSIEIPKQSPCICGIILSSWLKSKRSL